MSVTRRHRRIRLYSARTGGAAYFVTIPDVIFFSQKKKPPIYLAASCSGNQRVCVYKAAIGAAKSAVYTITGNILRGHIVISSV